MFVVRIHVELRAIPSLKRLQEHGQRPVAWFKFCIIVMNDCFAALLLRSFIADCKTWRVLAFGAISIRIQIVQISFNRKYSMNGHNYTGPVNHL